MLMEMACVISHHTLGTSETGVDRGRVLAGLDMELMSICHPPRTSKRDYTQTPSLDLGTNIFWTAPELGEVAGEGGRNPSQRARLERRARLRLFFYPEVNVL
jgi:hypothetical protein